MPDENVVRDELENMREDLVLEYRRLLACYQAASRDDRNVVWAALNKYLPVVDAL